MGTLSCTKQPWHLKKAQEELDIQVGKERLVNEQDISKLVYLQAILKEIEKIKANLKR